MVKPLTLPAGRPSFFKSFVKRSFNFLVLMQWLPSGYFLLGSAQKNHGPRPFGMRLKISRSRGWIGTLRDRRVLVSAPGREAIVIQPLDKSTSSLRRR